MIENYKKNRGYATRFSIIKNDKILYILFQLYFYFIYCTNIYKTLKAKLLTY